MAKHTVRQILNDNHVKGIHIKSGNHQKIEGIISEYRLDRKNETEGKYIYDIRHTDENWCEPATIENHVIVNWYGCLITDYPIIFPDESDYLTITDYTLHS